MRIGATIPDTRSGCHLTNRSVVSYSFVDETRTVQVTQDAQTESVTVSSNGNGDEEENTLTVTIIDAEGSGPIEGATVEAIGALSGPAESVKQGETNAEGVYEVIVSAVSHEIFVEADGFVGVRLVTGDS